MVGQGGSKGMARDSARWLRRRKEMEDAGTDLAMRIKAVMNRKLQVSVKTAAALLALSHLILAIFITSNAGSISVSMGTHKSVEEVLLQRALNGEVNYNCHLPMRIGAAGHQGWMVCLDGPLGTRLKQVGVTSLQSYASLRQVQVDCRVLSVGIGLDPSFEIELARKFGCKVDGFDHQVEFFKNEFSQDASHAEGWGLGNEEESASVKLKRFKLEKTSNLDDKYNSQLHPGYDIAAVGPGWKIVGGPNWMAQSMIYEVRSLACCYL
eukprot:749180-Hanusia_phi.AAC.1